MYEEQLNELRSVAEKIRSGQYSEERVEKSQKNSSLVQRASQRSKEFAQRESEERERIANSFEASMLETFKELSEPLVVESTEEPLYEDRPSKSGEARPKGREDFYQETGLTKDEAFMTEVERLQEKYPGLTKSELFRTIQGESGFNPKAQNPSGATGLFQLMPSTAAELGYTTDEIKSMAPAEQLRVYDQYLQRWGYDGNVALGIMQAAPAKAKSSPDEVIYPKGSAAWKQNPGWRPSDDGDITVASINAYYRGQ